MHWVTLELGYLHIQMLQKLSSCGKTGVDITNVSTGGKTAENNAVGLLV